MQRERPELVRLSINKKFSSVIDILVLHLIQKIHVKVHAWWLFLGFLFFRFRLEQRLIRRLFKVKTRLLLCLFHGGILLLGNLIIFSHTILLDIFVKFNAKHIVGHAVSFLKVNCLIFDKFSNCISNIVNFTQLYKDRSKVEKLCVLLVLVPRCNGNGLLWLHHVSIWRVID